MSFAVNFKRVEPVPGRKDAALLQLAVTQDDPDFARQCRYMTLLCAQSNQISGVNNEVNEFDIAGPRSFSPRHYCPRCNNLSTKHVPPGATAVVMGFLHDFEASVLAGCKICLLILAAVSPYRGPGRLKAYVRPGAALNIIVKSEDKNARYDLFTEFGQTPSPWPGIGQARLIAANSAEETVLEALRSWMQDCCAHKQCLARVQAKKVPTRLIDVADGRIRLDSSPSHSQPYVALSHCWGSITGLPKATKSNLGLLQMEIKWKDLTKTFQDAVVLTRRLGFRYIWIDSLCIVQDDESDWQKEAARMAATYANAELVVSATSSSDGSCGLFKDRKPPQILASADTETSSTIYEHARPPWKMRLRNPAGEEAVTFLVRDTARHAQWDPFDEVARSAGAFNPLLSRAWAFQERLLATRIVHFADHELVWECRESLRCECTHLDRRCGLPMMEREKENIKLELARALARPIAQASPLEAFRLWARIVEAYTERGLTFEKDRLLALSGVADQLVRHGLQNYSAGVFLENIPHSLLWHVEEPGTYHQAQIAPTWSWASVAKPAQRPPRVKFDWLSDRLAASSVETMYTYRLAGPENDNGVGLGLIAPFLTCTLQMRKVDHTPLDSYAFMHYDLQGSGFVYSVCCGGRSTPFSPDILLHQGPGKLEPGQQVHVLLLGHRASKAKPDCALVLRRLRVGELPEYTGVVNVPDVLKGGDVFIRIGLIRGLDKDRSDFLDGARREFVVVF